MTQYNPSSAADLVIHPEWIVPVVPKGAVLTGHSVIVNNGGITGIVPTEEAQKVQAT